MIIKLQQIVTLDFLKYKTELDPNKISGVIQVFWIIAYTQKFHYKFKLFVKVSEIQPTIWKSNK